MTEPLHKTPSQAKPSRPFGSLPGASATMGTGHHSEARRPLQPMPPAVRRQGERPTIPPVEPGLSPILSLLRRASAEFGARHVVEELAIGFLVCAALVGVAVGWAVVL